MTAYAKRATTLTLLTGVTIAGALVGCTESLADAAIDPTPSGTAESAAPKPTPQVTETLAPASTYVDGTYGAGGTYTSPGGVESISVILTLENDIITSVQVTGDASSGQAAVYQNEFAGGIGAVVVGQSLDSIQVTKVAGSSLTSGGFTAAVQQIKSDAAA